MTGLSLTYLYFRRKSAIFFFLRDVMILVVYLGHGIFQDPVCTRSSVLFFFFSNPFFGRPFKAPEPLPILSPSNYVPKNGFPVVKGLSSRI